MTLDLKTLLKLPADYPGFDFAYEKWAMEIYLKVLEDYLPQAQDQYRSSARRELMEQFGDHWTEEMKHEASEIDQAADREIPRFFRISAIMPIGGCSSHSCSILLNTLLKKRG